ncbi:MAG: glycosyltransferase family 4 protein [Burkholderiales bacterium]|nr:glycosyltransferase family 4 protein [Burkholderiales bacterium]
MSNYPLLLGRLWSKRKVAYWGHGKNFQSDAPTGLREKWKNFLLRRVDWWFAYTQTTVSILRDAQYPLEQITCLDNAIDNEGFVKDLAAVSDAHLSQLQRDLDVSPGALVGLFCGSLYVDKRLHYMVEAADRIHAAMPSFRLIVIGDGPGASVVKDAANKRPWLKMVGVRKGFEKAAYFRLASVVFNPGAVGLHVIDAFCAGIPMATTSDARHGPEFAYLEDGINGLAVAGNAREYADRIMQIWEDRVVYDRMCATAAQSAKRYTLTNMVTQFADGVEKCLGQ